MAVNPNHVGKMWYGDPVSPTAVSSPAPAAAPAAGTSLTMGPPAPGGGYSPAPAAAGGGGGPLAATQSFFNSPAFGGAALGFLGGMTGNYNLVSAGVNYGLKQAELQREQAIQDFTNKTLAGTDINNPEDIRDAAQKFLDAGMIDQAQKLTAEARTLEDYQRSDEKTQLDLVAPQLKRAQAIKFANEQASRALDRVNGDVSKLNEIERLSITTQYVTTQMPGVLSDEEYRRAAGAGDVNGMVNAVKRFMGLPPGAAPDAVIEAMLNQTEDAARQADDFIRWVDTNSSFSLKNMLRPVSSRNVNRPDKVSPSAPTYGGALSGQGSPGTPSVGEITTDFGTGLQSLYNWSTGSPPAYSTKGGF